MLCFPYPACITIFSPVFEMLKVYYGFLAAFESAESNCYDSLVACNYIYKGVCIVAITKQILKATVRND